MNACLRRIGLVSLNGAIRQEKLIGGASFDRAYKAWFLTETFTIVRGVIVFSHEVADSDVEDWFDDLLHHPDSWVVRTGNIFQPPCAGISLARVEPVAVIFDNTLKYSCDDITFDEPETFMSDPGIKAALDERAEDWSDSKLHKAMERRYAQYCAQIEEVTG